MAFQGDLHVSKESMGKKLQGSCLETEQTDDGDHCHRLIKVCNQPLSTQRLHLYEQLPMQLLMHSLLVLAYLTLVLKYFSKLII